MSFECCFCFFKNFGTKLLNSRQKKESNNKKPAAQSINVPFKVCFQVNRWVVSCFESRFEAKNFKISRLQTLVIPKSQLKRKSWWRKVNVTIASCLKISTFLEYLWSQKPCRFFFIRCFPNCSAGHVLLLKRSNWNGKKLSKATFERFAPSSFFQLRSIETLDFSKQIKPLILQPQAKVTLVGQYFHCFLFSLFVCQFPPKFGRDRICPATFSHNHPLHCFSVVTQ